MEGKNNSTLQQAYTFVHTKPDLGINYYRLKQLDFSGDYEYSEIRSVFFLGGSEEKKLQCFPNPAEHQLQVQLADEVLPNGPLKIVNSMGQIVGRIPLQGTMENIDISRLTPGTYILLLQTPNEISRFTFVKK